MDELFREIEHTGDLAIAVVARDLPDLYRRAGLALFALLVDARQVARGERWRVEAVGEDREDLMHEWLARLLADFFAEGKLAAAIDITHLDEKRIEAELEGERFRRDRHTLLREMKAVTYHALRIGRVGAGWEARITFDV